MRNSFKALFRTSNPNVPADMQPAPAGIAGIKTEQLRWLVLMPVMVIIFIMIGTLIAAVYRHANDEISREVQMLRTSSNEVYQDNLEHLTGMLAGITGMMAQNAELRSALANKDRAKLSKSAAPIFTTLQKEHEITHLYFIGADRRVLLRAHNPAHSGDVINRVTTLDAQLTKASAHGVELGPEGTLALRFVSPLYQDGAKQHLIGFIELGVDTSHLLKDIQRSLGIQIFEFLSKEFLKREASQPSMSDPVSSTEWDRFPDVVPSAQSLKDMTPEMSVIMSNRIFPATESMMEVSQGKSDFRAISFPILDMEERKVGSIVMLVDVTSKVLNARNTLFLGLILGVTGGSLLFAFFWLLMGRVGQLIEQHQEALRRLAIRDGLTGLYNRRAFDALLADELVRAQRFKRPVSLLLLDIDHFKRVNDTHGHQAGDAVLEGLGKLLSRQARAIDRVCRYGGEEITVILPETDLEIAAHVAERLRAAVEAQPFDVNAGAPLRITVSIGVASFPAHADNAQALVAAADAALYAAKQGGRNRISRYEPAFGQAAFQR